MAGDERVRAGARAGSLSRNAAPWPCVSLCTLGSCKQMSDFAALGELGSCKQMFDFAALGEARGDSPFATADGIRIAPTPRGLYSVKIGADGAEIQLSKKKKTYNTDVFCLP